MTKPVRLISSGDVWPLLVRFGIIGAFNTTFSYGIYAAGIYIELPYYLASLIALVFGILLGFVTHGRLVFRSQLQGRFTRYLAVWAALYVVNIGLIGLFSSLGVNYYLGGLMAFVPVVVLSFVLQKVFVFQR